ncbi:hypothetical protein CspHIS471_0302870 [Cutaneotrichosporon sp. HIS471]|nr:hypothetical protein CspHIS471_0302870 [Cutaneotrichosporon sp. HIS471]
MSPSTPLEVAVAMLSQVGLRHSAPPPPVFRWASAIGIPSLTPGLGRKKKRAVEADENGW